MGTHDLAWVALSFVSLLLSLNQYPFVFMYFEWYGFRHTMSRNSLGKETIRVTILADLTRCGLNVAVTILLFVVSKSRDTLPWWPESVGRYVLGGSIAACCACAIRLMVACASTRHKFRYGTSALVFTALEVGFLSLVLVFIARPSDTLAHCFQQPSETSVCVLVVSHAITGVIVRRLNGYADRDHRVPGCKLVHQPLGDTLYVWIIALLYHRAKNHQSGASLS